MLDAAPEFMPVASAVGAMSVASVVCAEGRLRNMVCLIDYNQVGDRMNNKVCARTCLDHVIFAGACSLLSCSCQLPFFSTEVLHVDVLAVPCHDYASLLT